jgi:nitroimidazol reductase NimA-like FMN-containing flavoprotein (pyridoxamine 5'-phosphate oxidase superfamily)
MPAPSARTRVARLPERGHYDPAEIYAILDAAFLCHVGFMLPAESGAGASVAQNQAQPCVIPTLFGRDGDRVYFHGSAASRMLRTAASGVQVCLEATIVDGIVLARSAFHHSMNYRSVVVFGYAELVTDTAQKLRALEIISEHVIPGRWNDVRQPTAQELKATSVLSLPLAEASAKIRTGPPKDEEADYALPIWAGVLPLTQTAGALIPDPKLPQSIAIPAHLKR